MTMIASAPLTNAEAAQAIAKARGPIIPVCYLEGGACACGGSWDLKLGKFVPHTGHDLGKAPISKLVIQGVDNATTNSATIDRWWQHYPKAGVGLALKPAGLVFIDPDSPEALAEAEALGVAGGLRRDSRNVGFLFKRQDGCPSDVGITKSGDGSPLEIQTFGYAVVWNTHADGSLVRVELGRAAQDTPAWAVERLKRKSADKAAQNAARAARRAERAAQGVVGDDPLWQLDAYGMDRWNGTVTAVDDDGKLDRSRSLWHIGLTVAEAGATVAGIRWAVENRDNALGFVKYAERGDADVRYDEIAEKAFAWANDPKGPTVVSDSGSDGAETCQGCTERDKTIASMAEHLKTYRAAEHLVRSGTVPAAEALVLEQLTKIRAYAQSKGDSVASLYVPEVARTAGVGDTTVTRAFNQLRRWQLDPELSARLPFRIEDHGEGKKSHLRLRVVPLSDEENGERSRAAALVALGQMPRDEGRQKHGGERIACPNHPESAIVRTRQWRCTEDDCTWVQQDTARIEPRPDQDGPVRTSTMYGATFFEEVRAATPHPDQDGPLRYTDSPDQDGPDCTVTPAAPGQTVSFVSREMMEAAAGPRLRLVAEDSPPVRTQPWQCPCGSYERYPRQGGGYRCDGCSAVTLPAVVGAEE